MPKKPQRSEDSYIFHDILPAFSDFGYPSAGDEKNLKIKGDIPIKIGSGYYEPDVVYYAQGIPVLLVESKKPNKNLEQAQEQAKSYIRNFPIEKYSIDGRPPQYAAVTIGKIIYFYKYERDINRYGGITDNLAPVEKIPSYDALRELYGLKEEKKPVITPELFKDIFYSLIAALDVKNTKKISRELILHAVQLLHEFLKNSKHYTSKFPYIELDGHPERQRWIRNLLRQYDWSALGTKIAQQFHLEIIRSFQGALQLNQYITPPPVIQFMTSIVNVNAKDTVLDFECGSGGYIAESVARGVPLENVKGIDIDELPFYVSKLFLALHFNVTGKDMESIPIFHDNGLYHQGDDWRVVIGNPSGGDRYELKDLKKVYENLERDIDQNRKDDPAWEYNFSIQQAVRSAKAGGRICLVLPEGFFSNSSAEFLRKYVAKYCEFKAIISLPRGVFYKGTTVKSVQHGKQIATQKMSILYVIKGKKVKDGSGVEINIDDINYHVFLAAVQKPSNVKFDRDMKWLNDALHRVHQEYVEWEKSGCLTKNNEPIDIHTEPHPKTGPEQISLELEKTGEKKTIEPKKQKAPPKKEETIIPDKLKDIF